MDGIFNMITSYSGDSPIEDNGLTLEKLEHSIRELKEWIDNFIKLKRWEIDA